MFIGSAHYVHYISTSCANVNNLILPALFIFVPLLVIRRTKSIRKQQKILIFRKDVLTELKK
jgi:hypothetical protein